MRRLLLKSFLVAVLIGPLTTFVFTVAYARSVLEYQPGISEEEFKSYDNRTVSDFQAFLKSRQVKISAFEALRKSMGQTYFWKRMAQGSIPSSLAAFLGCIIVGASYRRCDSGQTVDTR